MGSCAHASLVWLRQSDPRERGWNGNRRLGLPAVPRRLEASRIGRSHSNRTRTHFVPDPEADMSGPASTPALPQAAYRQRLVVYVVWHPKFAAGRKVADAVWAHLNTPPTHP